MTVGVELEYADVRPVFVQKYLPMGWRAYGDSSIRNTDGSWSKYKEMHVLGTEIVTVGGFTQEQLFSQLGECLAIVADLGGTPNRTCGLHVHVGVGYQDKAQMLHYAQYFADHPTHQHVNCSAQRARVQCARIDSALIDWIRKAPEELLPKAAVAHVNGRHNYHRERDVNVLALAKYGTLEFRGFPSTLNPQRVQNAVLWALQACTSALKGDPLPDPILPMPEAL